MYIIYIIYIYICILISIYAYIHMYTSHSYDSPRDHPGSTNAPTGHSRARRPSLVLHHAEGQKEGPVAPVLFCLRNVM